MALFLRNRNILLRTALRNICASASTVRKDTNPSNVPNSAPPHTVKQSATEELRMGGRSHKVDNLEKRFLVWSGKYKSIEDVPSFVTQEAMEKARNKARIKIANYMMLITALACIAMVISGKRASERGESVQKMNLEWHRLVKEEEEQKDANKK